MTELPPREFQAHHVSALSYEPPPALTGAAADLQNPTSNHIAEQLRVGLVEPFRSPNELPVTKKVPVLGLVGVSRLIPPSTIRAYGFFERCRTADWGHDLKRARQVDGWASYTGEGLSVCHRAILASVAAVLIAASSRAGHLRKLASKILST
jgi:hypothetical protein